MLKRLRNKRGISPLIATVLLIGLVMVLGLIFFLFVKKQISAQTEKVDCGAQEQITVDVAAECEINDGTTTVKLSNLGKETIDGLRIVCTQDNDELTSPPPTLINCKEGEDCPVSYNLECKNVEVLPGVVKEDNKGNPRFVLCTDKSIQVQCS